MITQEVHLELLIGKQVRDPSGKAVGRIEEVRAKQQGEQWIIQEYLIGRAALLERLSAWTIGLSILHILGARKINSGYRVPWDQLDLTDPEQPRLYCDMHELQALTDQSED